MMIHERTHVEAEWIEARSDKLALQRELRDALKADPALKPAPELLDRYERAKRRCAELQTRIMVMLDRERRQGATAQ